MAHQMTVASNHENLEEGFSIHQNLEVLLPVSSRLPPVFFLPVSNLKLFPWRLLTVEGFGGIIHPLWLPSAW